MIRCSAFCLTFDDRHARRAAAAAAGINRVSAGATLTEDLGDGKVTALPLERGRGLPVVHGWLAPERANGEFSMLSRNGETIVASRDSAGTRPLYVAKSGSWISSDHRFFPQEEAVLLPPDSIYDPSAGMVKSERRRQVSFQGSFEEAGTRLATLIEQAVEERVVGKKRIAVAFSGGLDSSILASCARKHSKVLACTVHSRGSRDSAATPTAARALGVELLAEEVDARALGQELSLLNLPFEASPMDRALWCIYSIASRAAANAGAAVVLLGQLADELFGGYAKYQRVLAEEGDSAVASLMQADVLGCGMRGFTRDEAACSRWLEPRFPFADRRVLDFGQILPVGFKIRKGVRKAVLRHAALRVGVPRELSSAPKKAAQYSSGIQKMLE